MRTLIGLTLTLMLSAMLSISAVPARAAVTNDSPGSWTTYNCPGINPIHAAMLPSGNILMMAGSGYNRVNSGLKINQAWIYNPGTPDICPREITLPAGRDLFCAGMVHLPDGRIVVFGGTGRYGESGSNPFTNDDGPNRKLYYGGIKDAYVFNETTETFDRLNDMDAARWYGNDVIRADGSIVVYGGADEDSQYTKSVQVLNPTTLQWAKPSVQLNFAMPMYAGNVLLPNGWYLYSGTNFGGQTNGQSAMRWSPFSNTKYAVTGLSNPQCRDEANTIVMYPKVYVLGGGCTDATGPHGVTGMTSVLDMSKSPMQFTTGPYAYAGMHQCAAGLPDQSLFLSGGSDHNKKDTAPLRAMTLDKNETAWQPQAAPSVKRGYHSTCLVDKAGRVITMGTNWNATGDVETRIEIYNPWYATPGFTRPRLVDLGKSESCGVTELTPGEVLHTKTEVATITGGTLTKIPSVTHQYDPNNRVVPVQINQTSYGNVDVTVPAVDNVTPKGLYLLSLLDWRGAPTTSKMVNLGGHGCCC